MGGNGGSYLFQCDTEGSPQPRPCSAPRREMAPAPAGLGWAQALRSVWAAQRARGRQSAGALLRYRVVSVALIQAAAEFCRTVQNMLVVCESCVSSCLVAVA